MLALIALLIFGQGAQLFVPVRLEGLRHETIAGIDEHIALARAFGLVSGSIQLLAA